MERKVGKAAERKEAKAKWIISDIIYGIDTWEDMQRRSQGEQRLYKQLKRFMSIFPDKMIEKMKGSDPCMGILSLETKENLAKYFLYKEVADVFTTYSLLKQNPPYATTVSGWRERGYFLRERDLRTLHEWGYIIADLNRGLDNITLK
jgi:hypothetical protein